MQRALALAASLLLVILPVAARAAPPSLGGWDLAEQRAVDRAGLLPALEDGDLHGERPVAGTQLRDALGTLASGLEVAPVTGVPRGRVSVTSFDALLVRQLGLGDVAAAVQAEAHRAGLRPLGTFGTEAVARMLALRHDQPYGADQFELYPWEAITRAEVAWSLARALDAVHGGAVTAVREQLGRFVLPRYSPRQLRVLRIAVAKVGMPYVWGGETDTRSAFFGGQVHGGYDCSGLAWRVFKLSGLPQGRRIGGRTAAGQAGEIPRGARVGAADVLPGDLLFFGPGRFWQRATERRIVHEGIALSPEWMVHSSGSYGGVSIAPLFTPARASQFSWARRLR